MSGQLRVAVIGSQTCHPDSSVAYTVYRTSVNYEGLCYHRLIRFRCFSHCAKKLKLAPDADRISVKLPPKIWWSRKMSLQPETVEARQVVLNEYIHQVCTRPLTPRSQDRLMKLLRVGDYAPKEEEDRVINSRISFSTDEFSDNNYSQKEDLEKEDDEPKEELSVSPIDKKKQPQLARKEGGRVSTDMISNLERQYFGQIKKCLASIDDVMDSSRKLEVWIREKQTGNQHLGAKAS